MKPLILALLLLMPFAARAQDSRLKPEYDRFENRTRYWTPPTYVGHRLEMRLTFSFRGRGAGNEIEAFHLVFTSKSSDWRFIKDARLYCRIDNRSVDLGKPLATDNEVQTGYDSVTVSEIMVFPVKYQQLQQIIAAKNVEMRLGSEEFRLLDYQRSNIKQLLGKVKIVKR